MLFDAAPLAERMRPKSLEEYIGQQHLVGEGQVLRKMAETGRLVSMILWGPPGVGKTTLANILANAADLPFFSLSAVSAGVKDVKEVIEKAQRSGKIVLFIDEIHRLNRVVEEVLYPAMEDFTLDIVIGKGPAARSIRLDLPKFTLIGATTRIGLISSPLRDRFGLIYNLDFYNSDEIEKIIKRSAKILKVKIDSAGAKEIASRARKTPRIANRLLKRVRDFAQMKANGEVTEKVAHQSLDMLEVDNFGLDNTDRRLLKTIIDNYSGGPVGLSTLAAATSEEIDTIEDVYEPYLIRIGFLERTPRGRKVTNHALKHLGYEAKAQDKLL